MQQYSNTEDRTRIEELLGECKPWIEKLARKYVGRGRSLLDFDDYVNAAVLRLWERADMVLAAGIPLAYACKVAENAMIDEYNKFHKVFSDSLDVSQVRDGATFSLADLLPDVPPVRSTSSKRVRALNDAIRRIRSPRHRAAVRRRAGLPGYGYHSHREAMRALKVSSNDAVQKLDQRGRKALRKDALLCAAVGVEVRP